MRKTAQRKLRQAFARAAGRMPNGIEIVKEGEKVVGYIPSEWRRLKKQAVRWMEAR